MSIKKHVHKLKRLTYSNDESIYFCVLDCDYKIKVPLALGKSTICWRCGKEFTINEYALRLVKPICPSCKQTKGKPNEGSPVPDYPSRPTTNPASSPETRDLLSRFKKAISNMAEHTEDGSEDLL